VTEDWYQRLTSAGVLDVLAPYQPAVVGAHPLGIAAEGTPVEIVCRATDLPAFARVVERAFGSAEGFALYGGSLDGEEAVFAELTLEGLPLEIAGQPEHVHRRVDQFDLSRTALESLANANPALVARVMGIRRPGPDIREYVIAVALGVSAEVLIVAAGAARGSQEYTGLMLMLQAVVLGVLFGARLGLVAALAPLVAMGAVIASSITVGSESCSPDCGQQSVSYLFVGVLVAAAAGTAGVLRDRYFPRAA